jgi:hypothetical protein
MNSEIGANVDMWLVMILMTVTEMCIVQHMGRGNENCVSAVVA